MDAQDRNQVIVLDQDGNVTDYLSMSAEKSDDFIAQYRFEEIGDGDNPIGVSFVGRNSNGATIIVLDTEAEERYLDQLLDENCQQGR